jgi:hypothetical protein
MRGAQRLINSFRLSGTFQQIVARPEWRSIVDVRPNVMVRTRAPQLLMRAFASFAREPIQVLRGWRTPRIETGTLVIHRVESLDVTEQRELLRWIDRHRAVQCVSLVRRPLYSVVSAGRFLAELYYRLNAIYLTDADCVPAGV